MISPWRKRDNFSVARHQELVDGVNLSSIVTATGELQAASGGGRTIVDSRRPIVEEIFFGTITDTGPGGESDWTDARYFVQRKVPTMPAVTTDPITMEDDVNPESEMTSDGSGNAVIDDIVTATNPGEIGAGTHNLQVDDPVTVAAVYAYKDDKLYKLYVILTVPAGGSIDVEQAGTVVVASTPYINIPANRGTSGIFEMVASTVAGRNGADLQFKSGGSSNRAGIYWSTSSNTWIIDYLRFTS